MLKSCACEQGPAVAVSLISPANESLNRFESGKAGEADALLETSEEGSERQIHAFQRYLATLRIEGFVLGPRGAELCERLALFGERD